MFSKIYHYGFHHKNILMTNFNSKLSSLGVRRLHQLDPEKMRNSRGVIESYASYKKKRIIPKEDMEKLFGTIKNDHKWYDKEISNEKE